MIIVRIWEGLGNQLFQYAYAKALSIKTGERVCLDVRESGSVITDSGVPRTYKLNNFNISVATCTNPEARYPFLIKKNIYSNCIRLLSGLNWFPYKFYKEEITGYHEKLMDLHGNWYLQGYFQSVQYFQEYEEAIRKDLSPKKKIRISKELRSLLKENACVSIHIRRGDYNGLDSILPTLYYNRAMAYIKDQVENPIWIIFSDEPEWVKDNLEFGTNCYFVSDNESLEDYEELLVMSKCKHNIISNSTFSWWAAWLNSNTEKIVVGPKKWFLGGMSQHAVNIMLEDWIKL